ncbi:MAG TPA: hypothetical protein VEC99_06325 [Clostridia bacterium]|nr:hypothetical protein [Clostridia bacterium]
MKTTFKNTGIRHAGWWCSVVVGLGVMAGTLCATAADAPPATGSTKSAENRIGVYNSRAVALAFYRSEAWNAELKRQMAERDKAKAAGDNQRVAALEKWGKESQDRAHRQTFGDAPIDNILAYMTNSLPQIKEQANVQTIAARAPATGSAQTVDITAQMVKQFNPTEKTLKMIEDLKKHPPMSADKFPIKD